MESSTGQDLRLMSASAMAEAIRARELSPVEAVEASLRAIEEDNGEVNAFVTLIADEALEAARQAEEAVVSTPAEELGRLHGVPIGIKDLTPTAGVRTTFGAAESADHVPDEDGLTWARLKAEGPVLLGKTATPAFGMSGVTESKVHGRTNNPWNLARTVGGSSGGTGAALAAGFLPIATGSDGGGSIRVPSAYCGVLGHKPAHGRVPIYTEAPAYETVDVVGPMGRNVRDVALMLSIMAGPHSRDPFSLLEMGVDFTEGLADASAKGLRVALSPDLGGHGPVADDVAAAVQRAADRIGSELRAEVGLVEVPVPDPIEYFLNYWSAEVEVFFGPGGEQELDPREYPHIAKLLEIADTQSAADYVRTTLVVREQTHEAFAAVFDDYDILLTPTVPQTAFEHPDPTGPAGPPTVNGVEIRWPELDFFRFTEPPSHAGLPCLSMPCGLGDEDLPVGLQIIGPHGADHAVLRAAAAFEPLFGEFHSPLASKEV